MHDVTNYCALNLGVDKLSAHDKTKIRKQKKRKDRNCTFFYI